MGILSTIGKIVTKAAVKTAVLQSQGIHAPETPKEYASFIAAGVAGKVVAKKILSEYDKTVIEEYKKMKK